MKSIFTFQTCVRVGTHLFTVVDSEFPVEGAHLYFGTICGQGHPTGGSSMSLQKQNMSARPLLSTGKNWHGAHVGRAPHTSAIVSDRVIMHFPYSAALLFETKTQL